MTLRSPIVSRLQPLLDHVVHAVLDQVHKPPFCLPRLGRQRLLGYDDEPVLAFLLCAHHKEL